ncbi:hypothetical protein PV783_34315 [Chitinophaga sp. CC14]|uniref:hypothetical protein n=1 Tax=Chitinophaga sp. CC14 TaxID=3029199 RepID=UPI003B7A214D
MAEQLLIRDIYPYVLPEPPRLEKDILYYDRKKADQYWTRPLLPDFRRMSTAQKTAFIEQEWTRLEQGLWLFINGELTWITPMHYDFLMYSNIPDFGIPAYYDSQRIDFYFKDFINADDHCYGELVIKPRRYGYTGMTVSECLHIAMGDFGRNVGMASTNHDKAKESLFRPLIASYLTRPKYTRPEIYMPNGRPPQKEMRFQSNIIEELDEMMLDTSSGMRSWITTKATTPKTFDGGKWHKAVLDEIFKWTEASVYQTWQITKETLSVGGRICGKGSLFATMGDDETMDEAVRDGIRLWGESDYHDKNKFGFTKSGLYRYFIPAYAAFELFIDRYGKCNEALAMEYLMEQRSAFEEGTLDYQYHVRKYPFTPEEAMSSAENSTMFSSMRLNSRLQKLYVISNSERPYVVGNFEQDAFTDQVRFVPNPKGYWKVMAHPHPDARNRCRRVNGRYVLPRNPEGCIGNDPTRTAENSSGHLSMSAAYVYQKHDYYNTGNANRLMAQLFGRDEDVDVMNKQIMLAALYYGYPVMTERQVTSTYDMFRSNGMKDFLLISEYDKVTGLWMKGQVINDGLELIQKLIKKPKLNADGVPEGPDNLDHIVFEELITQLKNFQKAKSTKYDCVMALIATLIGAQQILYTILTDAAIKRRKKVLSALHPSRLN